MTTDAAQAARPDDDDLVLLPEFAAMIRQSEATTRWLIHKGETPPAGKIGRRLVWRRGDVRAFIAQSFDRPGQLSA